jgi:ferrous iron transport protein A
VRNKSSILSANTINTLAELKPGGRGVIERIVADISLKRKLSSLGIVKGKNICVEHTAPMGDPRVYSLLGYQLSLRNEDARKIILRATT